MTFELNLRFQVGSRWLWTETHRFQWVYESDFAIFAQWVSKHSFTFQMAPIPAFEEQFSYSSHTSCCLLVIKLLALAPYRAIVLSHAQTLYVFIGFRGVFEPTLANPGGLSQTCGEFARPKRCFTTCRAAWMSASFANKNGIGIDEAIFWRECLWDVDEMFYNFDKHWWMSMICSIVLSLSIILLECGRTWFSGMGSQ